MKLVHWVTEAFRRAFEYSGRSRRMEFWGYAAFAFVAINVVQIFEIKTGLATGSSELPQGGPLNAIASLCLFIPALSAAVRRLHDANFSGWWAALPCLPIVAMFVAALSGASDSGIMPVLSMAFLAASIALVVLLFLSGTRGPNRFGEDPKSPGLGDTFS